MPAEIHIITGPARSGKTARLLALVGEELAAARTQGRIGTSLLLTPNSRAMDGIRQRLLGSGAILGLGLRTFDQFAEALLGGAIEAGRPLSHLQRRGLLASVLGELHAAGKLEYFAQLADRPSLVETLGNTIAELKQHGITPARLMQRANRSDSTRDREVALIYAEYQQRLDASKLYDAAGRLALASAQVRRGELGTFADLRLIVVDEHTTFTRAQLEFLSAWADRVERIAIGLTLDKDAIRLELFATTLDTFRELRGRFEKLKLDPPSRRTGEGDCTATLCYLQRHLFVDPRQTKDEPPATNGLSIIAAASQQDEVLQVARRVKRLLVDGLPAREILITARSLATIGPRIRDAFSRYGIPCVLESSRKIGEEPLLRSLIALLELDANDWPFRKLVRLLTNRRLTAWDKENRRGFAEWIVRELQFADGREELLKAVNKLAVPNGEEPSEVSRRHMAADYAAPLLNDLASAIDALPQSATAMQWYSALDRLAKYLGIVPENADAETALRKSLREADHLATWEGQPPQELDRESILKLLRDIASHEPLPERIDDVGCVRVIAAPTARLLSVKHLFVMGMVEQSFPLPERVGEIYNDHQLDAIAGERHDKRERPDRSSAEMLLFYELVSTATESITFSYPALDAKAQPQFASPYLQDVGRLFGDGAIPRTRPEESLRAVPTGEPVSDGDWRLQAVDLALQDKPQLLAGLMRDPRTRSIGRGIRAGLNATHYRTRGEGFGPFEGVFAVGPAQKELTKRYNSEHLWSPSQLEKYAECPFRFFMEHVSRIEPPGELLLDTDPLRKGTLAHAALAILHRKLRERVSESQCISHLGGETIRDEYLAALYEAREQLPAEGIVGALADLEMSDVARWATAYAAQHEAYDKKWSSFESPLVPSHFEVRFGPSRDSTEDEDSRSTDEPFVLQVGKETLQFTGRIDRIDVGRAHGQMVISIVDYKTGSNVRYETANVEAGKQLQLVLYAMAAEQHLFRDEAARAILAGYWELSNDKLEGRTIKRWVEFQNVADGLFASNEGWSKTWKNTSERLVEMVNGIRKGEFPMLNEDEKCTSRCDFRTVCRVGVARSLEKIWPPRK